MAGKIDLGRFFFGAGDGSGQRAERVTGATNRRERASARGASSWLLLVARPRYNAPLQIWGRSGALSRGKERAA